MTEEHEGTNWARLREPFPADQIEWKPGAITRDRKKGLAMAYINARAVQDRLDEVFGVDGWRNEYRAGPEGGVLCRIYFKNDAGEWVWKEDGADNTDVEAVKGGLSNALKRAASALGIGRYLYDLPAQWVPLNEKGRFAETPRLPRAFLPDATSTPTSPPARTRPPANVLTSAEGGRLMSYAESLGLKPDVARRVFDAFRDGRGYIAADRYGAVEAALERAGVTGELPNARSNAPAEAGR